MILKNFIKATLVIPAYEEALSLLNKSLKGFENGDYEKINYYIIKAHAIISELIAGLNYKGSEKTAINLYRIYEYLNCRMEEANINKDPKPVKETIGILESLKDVDILD